MSDTIMNGRPQRKTLSSQLDRLENIIDALAEGLPDSVAQAVRQAVSIGVQEAIHTLVQEAIHNPEVVRQLLGALPPAPPAPPAGGDSGPSSMKKACFALGEKLGAAGRWASGKLAGVGGWAGHKVSNLRVSALLGKVWDCRGLAAQAAVVGLLTGLAGYLAGPAASAVALGLCGTTIFVSAALLLPLALLVKEMNAQNP